MLIIDDQLMAKIRVVIDWYRFSLTIDRTSCVDMVIRVHVQRRETTRSELFYQFRPQGFLKKRRMIGQEACVTSFRGCCAKR